SPGCREARRDERSFFDSTTRESSIDWFARRGCPAETAAATFWYSQPGAVFPRGLGHRSAAIPVLAKHMVWTPVARRSAHGISARRAEAAPHPACAGATGRTHGTQGRFRTAFLSGYSAPERTPPGGDPQHRCLDYGAGHHAAGVSPGFARNAEGLFADRARQ